MMLALILAYIGKFIGLNIMHDEYIGICYLMYCAITIAIVYAINKDYVFDNQIKREERVSTEYLPFAMEIYYAISPSM